MQVYFFVRGKLKSCSEETYNFVYVENKKKFKNRFHVILFYYSIKGTRETSWLFPSCSFSLICVHLDMRHLNVYHSDKQSSQEFAKRSTNQRRRSKHSAGLNLNLSAVGFKSCWLKLGVWIIYSRISAGLTFTVESSSSTAVRSSQSTLARRKECVRQWGGMLPYCGNTHQWKTRRNVQSCETSATIHTNTYVQIAAGLGLAFVVFSWLLGEFTLSLWYYPIQPVWPSGNPLFSYTHHLKLIRQAPDTVKRFSLSFLHTTPT